MTIPIQEAESQRIMGVLLVSVSTDSIWDNYEVLAGNARIFILICGAIILTCAVLLAYFLDRPFNHATLIQRQSGFLRNLIRS